MDNLLFFFAGLRSTHAHQSYLSLLSPPLLQCWLDHLKPLCKQHNAEKEYNFTFCVKFYAPHPNLLEDEYTRYLFALQIKKDLYRGQLQCSENTAALLAAFIVQGKFEFPHKSSHLARCVTVGHSQILIWFRWNDPAQEIIKFVCSLFTNVRRFSFEWNLHDGPPWIINAGMGSAVYSYQNNDG